MDIFNIEKTQEEIKRDEIRRCAEYRKGALEAHTSAYEVAFHEFWNNSIVTPQEQCDALGTNAMQFFITSQTTATYIKTLNPGWTPPEVPYEFTINADGTVLIGDKIVKE
jgi:hypothetical protein